MSAVSQPVLSVEGLTIQYDTHPGPIIAVNDITFHVDRAEILGLVGESGCGKSTTAMAILRLLHPPGRVVRGRILLAGADVLPMSSAEFRLRRWKDVSLIPQGAMNALNPVMRVGRQLEDAMSAHMRFDSRKQLEGRIDELLDAVDLSPRVRRMYPHELSGGMKQRVCIAMAVALHPSLVIADEPTSALDVVVQRLIAQNLLDIRDRMGISILLIGHDMGLIGQLADRIAVMYAGYVAEIASAAELFERPLHPYSRLLIASVPSIRERKKLQYMPGGPPDLRKAIPGCPFAERCPQVMPVCREHRPALEEKAPGHWVSCHLHETARTTNPDATP